MTKIVTTMLLNAYTLSLASQIISNSDHNNASALNLSESVVKLIEEKVVSEAFACSGTCNVRKS